MSDILVGYNVNCIARNLPKNFLFDFYCDLNVRPVSLCVICITDRELCLRDTASQQANF